MTQTLTPAALVDFEQFMHECGQRRSDLTRVLTKQVSSEDLYTPLGCMAISTPPQEGKTTWVSHYIAWQLIRNPRLNVIYASYSQFRANAVSRTTRQIVERFTPLPQGAKNVSQWRTRGGGSLLAAGRGTGVTGFSCDLLIIDDPVKDMKEALSEAVRKATIDWFSSVLITRMASLSQIIVICTRWHKDDLVAHVIKELNATYLNVPAQAGQIQPANQAEATPQPDPLGRQPGEWLRSVQNRSVESWNKIKHSVGTYVWQALYQGDPQVTGGSYLPVDKIDVIPHENIVFKDDRGFMQTLDRALVIQSWDLTFGTVGKRKSTSQQAGDYVAGHVYALVGQKFILVDRVHKRLTFTETLNEVLRMQARWPQTSRVYVEAKANGAALIDSLRKRAALIQPVEPRGSKEARALAAQPTLSQGNYAVVDAVYDQGMMDELRDFPFAKHDDDVDALTQAINNTRVDYFGMV